MRRLLREAAVLTLLTAALAVECKPLASDRFRSLVADGQYAVSRGDLESLQASLSELHRDIPCLDHAPSDRVWAEMMVIEAVASFAAGKDWESPLAAALRIRPSINRLVGRAHPMYDWEPPEPGPGFPLEPGTVLYVDGRPSPFRPPSDGWYLVQKEDDGYWESYWQREAPVSMDWILAPVDRPLEVRFALEVGPHLGVALFEQSAWRKLSVVGAPEDLSGQWIPWDSTDFETDPLGEGGAIVPTAGGTARARLMYGPLSVHVAGSLSWNEQAVLRDGRLSALYDTRHFGFGGGISAGDAVQLRVTPGGAGEPDEAVSQTTGFFPYFHVLAVGRVGGDIQLETTALLGFVSVPLQTGNFLLDGTVWFHRVSLLGGTPGIGGQTHYASGRFEPSVDVQGSARLISRSWRFSPHVLVHFGSRR